MCRWALRDCFLTFMQVPKGILLPKALLSGELWAWYLDQSPEGTMTKRIYLSILCGFAWTFMNLGCITVLFLLYSCQIQKRDCYFFADKMDERSKNYLFLHLLHSIRDGLVRKEMYLIKTRNKIYYKLFFHLSAIEQNNGQCSIWLLCEAFSI